MEKKPFQIPPHTHPHGNPAETGLPGVMLGVEGGGQGQTRTPRTVMLGEVREEKIQRTTAFKAVS